MRRFVGVAVAVLALCLGAFGCGVHSFEIMTPSGEPGWEIWCRGDPKGCVEEARRRCPSTYDVLPSTTSDILVIRCRERDWADSH